jgi:hypothetical protein
MREDGCVILRQPTHGAEASSSRAVLLKDQMATREGGVNRSR